MADRLRFPCARGFWCLVASAGRGSILHTQETKQLIRRTSGNFLDEPRPSNFHSFSQPASIYPFCNNFLATGGDHISLVCLAQVCASQAFESKGGTGNQRKLKLECAIFTFPFLSFFPRPTLPWGLDLSLWARPLGALSASEHPPTRT